MDSNLKELKEELHILQGQMEGRESEVRKLSTKLHGTEKKLVELQVKLSTFIEQEEQVTRDTFEKYRIDLRQVIGTYLEWDDSEYRVLNEISAMFMGETEDGLKLIEVNPYEFNRRYGKDLAECSSKLTSFRVELDQLGEINWQAIEEYDRQKQRYDFLKVQENQLKISLQDLKNTIEHINKKSKKRFKWAFEEIDARFKKVFPIVFGGGMAELKIHGDIDDPECGVDIIARPPGKKMQNINLMSGGEKALTAVALIFSIFLIRPSPFCLLNKINTPLDDTNIGRFNQLLKEISKDTQFILITHNKKTMELNDTLYGVTMQEPGISKAVSVQLQ